MMMGEGILSNAEKCDRNQLEGKKVRCHSEGGWLRAPGPEGV